LPENVSPPILNLVKIEGQGELSLVKKEAREIEKKGVVMGPPWV
jgi:hypothetical protein